MRSLDKIWSNIKFSDVLLFQEVKYKGVEIFSKPKLVNIVGINVWDMAMVIYYVDYKCFNQFLEPYDGEPENPKFKKIEIENFAEWSDYLNVLGHWKSMPNFNRLLKAYRKHKPFEDLRLLKLRRINAKN